MSSGNFIWRYVLSKALSDKLERSLAVPPFRRKNLEHLAFVINGPPQVVGLAIDPHEDCVEVPVPE